MAHFSIISSQGGQTIFEGAPRYVGAYLKPGYLEFGQIGSPTPINWHVGDYVVYSRTGKTYRLYRTPQTVEQGARNRYGASFLYENVQFFDDSKQLEFCPFTDLVPGDNTIHFSTQNTVSFFGKPLNVAERLQACLEAQYGSGSWEIRIVTTTDADLLELLDTEVEFAVAGVNCLEVLDKVYETWNGLGWIHTVENGVNVITIGASNVRTSANTTVPFAYDDGLVRVEKSIANADQIGTRLFAYGSMKNMDATYYRGLDIYNAESVDIEHLMIPLAYWGRTSNKPDARKAYIENAEAIAQLGLIPRTAYFDGTGDLPDIHPTIERMTIGEVYDAGGAGYLPSLSKWSRTQRIDEIVAATNPDDHGTSAEQGQKYAETISGTLGSVSETFVDHDYFNATIFSGTLQHGGKLTLKFGRNRQVFTLGSAWSPIFNLSLSVTAGSKTQSFPLDVVMSSSTSYYCVLPDSVVVSGTTAGALTVSVTGYIGEEEDASAPGGEGVFSTDVTTTVGGGLEYELSKTFTVTIPQIGFDIDNYADLGNGKTISMKTGMCAGRDFEVKDATYISSDDSWVLTLYRSIDEDLNIMFPNSDYEIAAGDQYVLLDIAMPEMYVTVASQRLFSAAMTLLADISVEQPFYAPQIDAKVVYNESRVLRDGMWMDISLDGDRQFVIIDSITIDENGSNIPTYEVALRETKGLEWTENVGRASSSRSSTSVSGSDAQQSSSSVDLSNYYTKPETDTQISSAITALNLGAAATYGVGSVASGNTGLVTGGSVYSAINEAVSSALKFQGITTTAISDGSTTNPITINNQSYTAKKGDVVLYDGKEYLWTGSAWEQLGDEASWALKTTTISAGTGLTGGGTLAANRTISLSDSTIASLALADSAYQKPSTGIPQTDLASALSTKIDNGSTAYGYFSNGILPYNHGGTGINSYTKGNLIYASANNTLAKLAPNTGTKQFLTMTSSVPSWDGVDETDVFGSSAIGSSSLPVYYTGSALATITSLDLLSKNTGYIKGNRFYLTSDIYFYTETVDGTVCVRLNAPFITSGDQIVISGTPGSGGGGGATNLKELEDVYHNASGVRRYSSGNVGNTDFLGYDSTKGWYAVQLGTGLSMTNGVLTATNTSMGTVTQVKVGNTAYNPTDGVVSLPAYPTTLPASDVSAWAKASTKPSYAFSEITGTASSSQIPDLSWNKITSDKPTTLSGYGITDALKIKGLDSSDVLLSDKVMAAGTTNKGDFSAQTECPTYYGAYISIQYDASKNQGFQIYGDTNPAANGNTGIYYRARLAGDSQTTYQAWRRVLDEANYSSFLNGVYHPYGGSTGVALSASGIGIGTSTISYPLTIVTSRSAKTAALHITDNNAASTWQNAIEYLMPNLAAGGVPHFIFGKEDSAKNYGYIGFYYAGNGSNSNLLSLGLHSVDHILTVSGAGNVGIGLGTTAPSYKFHVVGTSAATITPMVMFSDTSDYAWTNPAMFLTPNITAGHAASVGVGQGASNKNLGSLQFYYAGSGSNNNLLGLGLYAVDYALTISGAGNVGVGYGTAPASYKLDVNGTARVTSLKIGSATITWNSNGYLHIDQPLVTAGDQIVISGTPGGGGGGGATSLWGLDDVNIPHDSTYPGNGDLLSYDLSTHKWVNVAASSVGGVTSVVGQTGAVTAAQISSAIGLSGYVPTTRTVNSKALSSNITLSLDDIADGSTRKLANYLPLAGGKTITGWVDFDTGTTYEVGINYDINRANSSLTGAWAYAPLVIRDVNDSMLFQIGVLGSGGALSYAYLGTNAYNGDNLRISSSGVSWGANTILHAGNYSSYALPLTGGATVTGKITMGARIDMDNQVIEMGDGMLGAYNSLTPTTLYWYNGSGWQTVYHSGNFVAGTNYQTPQTTLAGYGITDPLLVFYSKASNQTWGNQTGTFFTGANDSTGGSIAFRRDNPAAGQMSMIIDGTVYVKEGANRVLDTGDVGSTVASQSSLDSYVLKSGDTMIGSLTLGSANANSAFNKNIAFSNTTGWARNIVSLQVDGTDKFHIGGYGAYTTGGSSNGIEYAFIGVNAFDGTNLRFGSDSTLKWGADTILHAGNYSSYALPLTGGTLEKNDTNILNINSTNTAGHNYMYFKVGGTNKAAVGYYSNLAAISNEVSSARIGVNDSGTPQYWSSTSSSTAQTILHTGNYSSFLGSVYHPYGGSTSVALSASKVGVGTSYSNTYPLIVNQSSTSLGDVAYMNSAAQWSSILYKASVGTLWSAGSNADGFFFWNQNKSGNAAYISNDGNFYVYGLSDGNNVAPVSITDNYAATTWTNPIKIFYPNLTAGAIPNIYFGKNATARNGGYIGFYYAGSGSTSNLLTLGLHSVDHDLTISGSGNVGIGYGTTAASYKLDVNGTIRAAKTIYVDGDADWPNSSEEGGEIVLKCLTNNAYNTHLDMYGKYFRIVANSTCYLDLDCSNGNFGIGIGNAAPGAKVHIKHTSYPNVKLTSTSVESSIYYESSGAFWAAGAGCWSNVGGASSFMIGGGTSLSNANWRMYITTAGNLVTAGDQVISSDLTLKTNLKDVTYSVSDIAKARAVEFDWKDGRGHSMGSIAQDWLSIAPALVHGEEGNMSLAYGQLALVNTILLARQSESHEERIAKLEKENAELKEEVKRLRMN